MRKNIQIVHQRHIHKKHIHKYINHRGVMTLNDIMGRHHSHGTGSHNRSNYIHSGGSIKHSLKHSHHKKPLHFKTLF